MSPNPGGGAGSNLVVVGVDGSPHSSEALRWAIHHAEAVNTTVEAVFAWQLPMIAVPGAFDREELEQRAKQFVVDIVSAVSPSPPVPVIPVVAEGDPAEALVTAAGHADLLVLGTRGRSPLRGLMLGSVSQTCAAAAPCPVVIVKLSNEGRAAAFEGPGDVGTLS